MFTPHDYSDSDALLEAVAQQDLAKVKELLEKVHADSPDKNGKIALLQAVYLGNLEIVKILLDNLDNKAYPDVVLPDGDGTTALMLAAKNQRLDIVRLLLSNHANPNRADDNGWTALMYAISSGQNEMVQTLLDNEEPKVDLGLSNKEGMTALKLATYGNQSEIVKAITVATFFDAVEKGDLETMKELLAQGMDPNVKNKSGQTVLMAATFKNHPEIVRFLLANKADPNLKTARGNTALTAASILGHLEIAKILLEAKADPLVVNQDGETAFIFAKAGGHNEVAAELLKYGASSRLVSPQSLVLKRLRSYLTLNKRETKPFENMEEGYCAGISSLWSYTMWLQDQPKSYFPKKNPDDPNESLIEIPRDDNDWFKATQKLITDWDGVTPLTKEQTAEFERFLSLIHFFQKPLAYLPVGQGDLDRTLIDTKGRVPQKEYSIASLFTLDQLKQLLKTEGVVQEQKPILIGCHNHATALFRRGNKYYYFDPNSKTGELETESIDKVAEAIFEANFKPGQENKPSPLQFKMFSLDGKLGKYPAQETVLNTINPSLGAEKGHADGYSGLLMAARSGSLESLKYFLAKGADPNLLMDKGLNALILAAQNGYVDVIEKLLANKKVDPNLSADFGMTPLMAAAQNNQLGAVKALLAGNADPNKVSLLDTAISLAAKNGRFKIVKALLANKADPNLGDGAIKDAIQGGHLKIVKALEAAGAKFGKEEIDLAEKNGKVEIVSYLREQEKEAQKKEAEKKPAEVSTPQQPEPEKSSVARASWMKKEKKDAEQEQLETKPKILHS